MRGNNILVSTEPMGRMEEGVLGAGLTVYPGMVVQRDYSVALSDGSNLTTGKKSGRWTYKLYAPGADGGKPPGGYWVVLPDQDQGRTNLTSYAAGERLFLYSPLPGDELNLLLADISGTGDTHTIGEVLIAKNALGKFIATTGSPDSKPATLQETVTAPTADTLAWCVWSGL